MMASPPPSTATRSPLIDLDASASPPSAEHTPQQQQQPAQQQQQSPQQQQQLQQPQPRQSLQRAIALNEAPLSAEVVRSFEDHVAKLQENTPPADSKRHRFRAYSYAGRSDAELDRWAEELSDVEPDDAPEQAAEEHRDGHAKDVGHSAAGEHAESRDARAPSISVSASGGGASRARRPVLSASSSDDEEMVELPSREQLRQMHTLPVSLGIPVTGVTQGDELAHYELDLSVVRALGDDETAEVADYSIEIHAESAEPFVIMGREDRLPSESAFSFYKEAARNAFDLFYAPLCVSVRSLRKNSAKLFIGVRAVQSDCTFSVEVTTVQRRLSLDHPQTGATLNGEDNCYRVLPEADGVLHVCASFSNYLGAPLLLRNNRPPPAVHVNRLAAESAALPSDVLQEVRARCDQSSGQCEVRAHIAVQKGRACFVAVRGHGVQRQSYQLVASLHPLHPQPAEMAHSGELALGTSLCHSLPAGDSATAAAQHYQLSVPVSGSTATSSTITLTAVSAHPLVVSAVRQQPQGEPSKRTEWTSERARRLISGCYATSLSVPAALEEAGEEKSCSGGWQVSVRGRAHSRYWIVAMQSPSTPEASHDAGEVAATSHSLLATLPAAGRHLVQCPLPAGGTLRLEVRLRSRTPPTWLSDELCELAGETASEEDAVAEVRLRLYRLPTDLNPSELYALVQQQQPPQQQQLLGGSLAAGVPSPTRLAVGSPAYLSAMTSGPGGLSLSSLAQQQQQPIWEASARAGAGGRSAAGTEVRGPEDACAVLVLEWVRGGLGVPYIVAVQMLTPPPEVASLQCDRWEESETAASGAWSHWDLDAADKPDLTRLVLAQIRPEGDVYSSGSGSSSSADEQQSLQQLEMRARSGGLADVDGENEGHDDAHLVRGRWWPRRAACALAITPRQLRTGERWYLAVRQQAGSVAAGRVRTRLSLVEACGSLRAGEPGHGWEEGARVTDGAVGRARWLLYSAELPDARTHLVLAYHSLGALQAVRLRPAVYPSLFGEPSADELTLPLCAQKDEEPRGAVFCGAAHLTPRELGMEGSSASASVSSLSGGGAVWYLGVQAMRREDAFVHVAAWFESSAEAASTRIALLREHGYTPVTF